MDKLIQILPEKQKIPATYGENLLDVLHRHNIYLRSDCGGQGRCNKCRVKVEHNGGMQSILSCQCTVEKDLSINIPKSSRADFYIMDKADLTFPKTFNACADESVPSSSLGIAVDLGTTTIAVYLCDISKRKVTGSVAFKNSQATYGDDVMSRIGAVGEDLQNLRKLQKQVVKDIEKGIRLLLPSFSSSEDDFSEMVVVGNPAMIHVFAGKDPSSIGVSPFKPVLTGAARCSSGKLGFSEGKEFHAQTLPNVSGFIGGDILAAALAVDMEAQPSGTLLIDLGTNGELLLKGKDHFFATSCATGPAFEGATLSCGMQATPGAVNAVEISTDQQVSRVSMINPAGLSTLQPSGICGAGVINTVAQLCRHGIIGSDGAFVGDKKQYHLVQGNPGTEQSAVFINQKDIRSVQLGKSALNTGIEFLLKNAGISMPEKIIVAGAFGSHLNKTDLIRLGMIPKIDLDHIHMVGNAAGSGAVMALCDGKYIQKAIQLAAEIKTIDLACDIEFQNAFVKNLHFPPG